MKFKIWVPFVIALLIVGTVFVYSQSRIKVSYGQSTVTWDSTGFGGTRTINLSISNDATSGTDTLWIALENDTVSGRMYPLKQGEAITFAGLQTRWVRTKTSANSIPRRIWGY